MTNTYEIPENLKKQLSYVSHEIRNNLSICEMYSEILKRKLKINKNNDESIQNAINCIQKSLLLINSNLTDLKAIDHSDKSNCNLSKIVQNAINLSKAYISEKNIDFNIDICPDTNIYVNENRFLSCIINIIKNAIESIDEYGVISISTYVNNEIVKLRIANNGSPIPDEMQDKIFEYGYTTKQTGSGYGLCLAKQYLESQNAQIKLIKSDQTMFEIDIQTIN